MDAYETSATYQLAETCCSSVSVADLIQLSEDKVTTASDILDVNRKQTYGEIRGLVPLRDNIAEIYAAESTDSIGAQDVLITPGAIAANTIAALALVTKGDHVICQFPTYQQLYDVPRSAGAEVDFWECKESNGWLPDLDELIAKITPKTKLIVLKYVYEESILFEAQADLNTSQQSTKPHWHCTLKILPPKDRRHCTVTKHYHTLR